MIRQRAIPYFNLYFTPIFIICKQITEIFFEKFVSNAEKEKNKNNAQKTSKSGQKAFHY